VNKNGIMIIFITEIA